MSNRVYLAECVTKVAVGAAKGAATSSGLGAFTWAQVVVLAASLLAAGGVILTLLVNAASARRQALTTLYGDALGAVAEYLEGPYRILRKTGEASVRFGISDKLSDTKTAIDHHQALMRLHADPTVADAYDLFVNVAKSEVGKQMHDAWDAPAITTDSGMNLNVALPRVASDTKRALVVEVMQAHLRRRWWSNTTRARYAKATREVQASVEAYEFDKADQTARGGKRP